MKVGLVQINNSFSGQVYFPYAVGLMQAYLQAYLPHGDRLEFLLPEYVRTPVDQAAERLKNANIVLFSIYSWNARISLEIARKLKQLNPGLFTVFGGPQVPGRSRSFLEAYPQISVALCGEGEKNLLDLFIALKDGDLHEVPGISYVDDRKRFIQNPVQERIEDLDSIPSPYLSGVFNSLMDQQPRNWIGLLETNRGCPFSCAFCDWGGAVQKKVYKFSTQRVFQELQWFASHHIEFIFCCDANFGILPRDLDIARFAVKLRHDTGFPIALSVQNTKNATKRAFEIQKTLASAGLNKGVTLSVQSLDPVTLKNVGRQNISLEDFHSLQQQFSKEGIETYTDIIIGLPGETYRSLVDGVSQLILKGQHNRIQFNNLSILPNSAMGDSGYQKGYGLEIVESSIINVHGAIADEKNEIQEYQQLVVGTATMPKSDWRRTRAFCWMAALVYFDKLLQIPILLLHEISGLSFGTILEKFAEADAEQFPTIGRIISFFSEKAAGIQRGESEYCHSAAHLDIYWPPDEYILIQLLHEDCIHSFYQESLAVLRALMPDCSSDAAWVLESAVALNELLLKRPFETCDAEFTSNYDVWEIYHELLCGRSFRLRRNKRTYQIDRTTTVWTNWEDFCREVIWYSNKKGAYLYGSAFVHAIPAGIPGIH